jgi:DNA-binding response OmpR family regulator
MLGLGQLEPDETLAGRPATQQLDTAASLLVVEDNKDMRDFIVSQFDQAYRVLEAAQGKQALELLAANRVDLVISDVMMPEMDGISLLEAIRNDETLNTMPVILLTARASDEDRLLALRAKADDFLAKPFNAEELGLKVSNLLERRSAITAESRAVAASEVPAPLDSVDAAFLEKAREITLQRLGEMDFDVDGLAEGLHMSRSTLRRHMEKAANMTPAQFIRQLRLELAHSYITGQCHRTLAETAFAVGFNHPGYFSKLYKKYTAELAATRDS